MTIRTRTHAGVDLASLKGLHFLPLGGADEIGMNANFYCYNGQWLMVDNGVTFQAYPEAVMMADLRPFLKRLDGHPISGLVITHAHEDHVGAAAYLWPELKCQMYATPFTANILRHKLTEFGVSTQYVTEIPLDQSFSVGSFDIEFITLTHSIPEPSAVVLRTPAGTIFHTGDWKIDPAPILGAPIDAERMKRIGDEGVLALVCDSTNVFEPGVAGSEKEVEVIMERLLNACKGKVIISCFSSNLARVKTIYDAACAVGREVCIVGRSLRRMVDAARQCGYFPENMVFVEMEDVAKKDPKKILIMTTGSQAEPRAALTLMSQKKHSHLTIDEGDTVILSSRVIPGNQERTSALHKRLTHMGAELVIRDADMRRAIALDEEDMVMDEAQQELSWGRLHVSGHPCREELRQIYSWLRPKILLPVHGEAIHIREQARLGLECQIPFAACPRNGDLLALGAKGAHLVDEVPSGRLALDGKRLIDGDGRVMRQRQSIAERGVLDIVLLVQHDQIREKILSCGVFENSHEKKEWGKLLHGCITDVFFGAPEELEEREVLNASDLVSTDVEDGVLLEQGGGEDEDLSLQRDAEGAERNAPGVSRPSKGRRLTFKEMEEKITHLRRVIRQLFQQKWNKFPVIKVSFVFLGMDRTKAISKVRQGGGAGSVKTREHGREGEGGHQKSGAKQYRGRHHETAPKGRRE